MSLRSFSWVLATVVGLSWGASAQAQYFVNPVGVKATSTFGAVDVFGDGNFSSVFAVSLINGNGLVNELGEGCAASPDCLHDFDGSATTMWHAGSFDAGLPGGESPNSATAPIVNEQALEFEFQIPVRLNTAYIWQMNQGGLFGELAPSRGVDEFTLLVSPDLSGSTFTSLGNFNLAVETGKENVPAQVLSLSGEALAKVRRVRFEIQSVHSPLGEAPLAEFVGLSEVRFGSALPGDLNSDGVVDAADAGIMFENWSTNAGFAQGDINDDGQIDAADAGIMFENWSSVVATAAIPEPASGMFGVGLLLTLLGHRRGLGLNRR